MIRISAISLALALAIPTASAGEPSDPRQQVGRANASARVQPDRQGFRNAIQQYAWADGALYQVYAAPGQVTDIVRARHAQKLVEVHALMRRLDATDTVAVDDEADKIVSAGFDALARSNVKAHEIAADYDLTRGLDHVCFTMLKMMSFRARLDWGGSYAAKAQEEALGEVDEDLWPVEQPDPVGAFPTFAHRDAVTMNIDLFESNSVFKGAAFREVARAHLLTRDWKAVEIEAEIVAQAAGIVFKPRGPLFEAVAERILRRLAEHRFSHWPTGVEKVLLPMMTAMANHLPAPASAGASTPASAEASAPAKTLKDAFAE